MGDHECMEKDIELGNVAELKLSITGGQAQVSIVVNKTWLNGDIAVASTNSATLGAAAFLDLIFSEIESKSSAGAQAIEENVKNILKNAVSAL